MAKVTYPSGDTEQYGYSFVGGKAVEVTDEKHLKKFRGNRFFEVDDAPDEPAPPAQPEGPFVAKEKSPGWWAIYDKDGAEVGKSIRETEATGFNALSDADKVEYVTSELTK